MIAMAPFFAPILALLFMAATFAVVFTIKSKRNAKRKAEMEALASTIGSAFSVADHFGLAQQLKQFELFQKGMPRLFRKAQIANILRSQVGDTEVYLFDYSYVVPQGKSARRISQTVFFANDKTWFLPNFRLRPERWWHKALKGLGLERDINFEDNEAFSEKFWLKSEFEDIVRKQFTPDLQQFMLEKPPVHLEGENYYLTAYKPGKLLDAKDAKRFFENCCELVKLLKSEGKMELLQLAEVKKEAALEVLPPTPLEKS